MRERHCAGVAALQLRGGRLWTAARDATLRLWAVSGAGEARHLFVRAILPLSLRILSRWLAGWRAGWLSGGARG